MALTAIGEVPQWGGVADWSSCRTVSFSVILSTYFLRSVILGEESRLFVFLSFILKTAGCLSPLFLCQQVVWLSCSYGSRSSSIIPKKAGVSFFVILQAAVNLVLRYSSDNKLFFSVILVTKSCLSLLYSKDRRFSISPLVFRLRMVILSLFWNSRLSFFPLFLRHLGCPSLPLLLRQQVVLICYTLQRKNAENLKQIFPEKEYRGLSPNFHIHVSVSELYIPSMGLPFLLEEICELILGIYKSLRDTWMWKLGLRPGNSQKRNI